MFLALLMAPPNLRAQHGGVGGKWGAFWKLTDGFWFPVRESSVRFL
jgi:hypothetical protein